MKFFLSIVVFTTTIITSTIGECWDTGCQLNTWKVRGCEQYNMVETGRKSCENGIIYSCCSSGGGSGPAPGPNDGSIKYGDATYYNLGMTACGEIFSDNEMVAAIAFSYFTTPNPNNDPMCKNKARVTDPTTQKSVVVFIKDKCSGCQIGDIDLSPAAFQQLRPLSTGRFKVNWNFI